MNSSKVTANTAFYPALIEIGLEGYLKQRGGGVIQYELHTEKIDRFVQGLSVDQKKMLKQKIDNKKNETHTHNIMMRSTK